jgi:hypothetical protein
MVIALTYYKTGKATLVPLEGVQTMYSVFDTKENKYSTKISYRGGEFINVEETPEDIYKIIKNRELGVFQDDFEWDKASSVDDRFSERYHHQEKLAFRPQRSFGERNYGERNFNRDGVVNDTQW